jgi:hypothetical protein
MKTAYPRVCLASLAIASLTACGTSSNVGGVGGVGVTVKPNFTSWTNSIKPGATLVASGDSQQGTYSYDLATNKITATTVNPQQAGVTFTEIFTMTTPLLAKDVRFQTASGTDIRFIRVNRDNFFDPADFMSFNGIQGMASEDGTKYLVITKPVFDYQAYGIWATGAGTTSGTYGAVSVGAPSPISGIPAEGLATFIGSAIGRYLASDGSYFFTAASMSTSANFFTRELTFTTSSTRQVANIVDDNLSNLNNALNMTGTLGLIPGTNQFSGTISTAGGMTGTAKGRFYGPAAQEIGGTFSVTGAGLEAHVGAFGGNK